MSSGSHSAIIDKIQYVHVCLQVTSYKMKTVLKHRIIITIIDPD